MVRVGIPTDLENIIRTPQLAAEDPSSIQKAITAAMHRDRVLSPALRRRSHTRANVRGLAGV